MPLRVEDFKSARDIFVNTFKDTPIADFNIAWKSRIPKASHGVYINKKDLVGFILCDVGGYRYKNTHITFIAVHPFYQKFKLGTHLLELVLLTECEAKRSVSLTPLYVKHVWDWYHRKGFYVTYQCKTTNDETYTLMNFHPYETRRNSPYLMSNTLDTFN